MSQTRSDLETTVRLSNGASGPSDWDRRVFTIACWVVLTALATLYVKQHASPVPVGDVWEMVPVLTGREPVSLGWLWRPHNEHRIVLPRLVQMFALWTTGDIRTCSFLNVAMLSGLALAMMVSVGRIRGRANYGDAVFPFALLHVGQHLNLLLGFQIQFCLSTTIVGVVLLIIATSPAAISRWRVLTVGFLLICLCLTGSNGLALIPSFGLWLGWVGIVQWRNRETGEAILTVATVGLIAAFFASYLFGLRSHVQPEAAAPQRLVQTALQFLAEGFGPVAGTDSVRLGEWPLFGLFYLLLALPTAAFLVWLALTEKDRRPRLIGLIAFGCAMGSLAFSIGWGRGGIGPFAGSANRYGTIAVPAICCLPFLWQECCREQPRRLLSMGLFTLIVAVSSFNYHHGRTYGKDYRAVMGPIERDFAGDTSSASIVDQYHKILHPNLEPAVLVSYVEMWRQGRSLPEESSR